MGVRGGYLTLALSLTLTLTLTLTPTLNLTRCEGAIPGGAAGREPAPPAAEEHYEDPEDAPDPQELPGGRVSRFKAARMRGSR